MINELLRKLEKVGYSVSLNGDKISLDFVGEVMPSEAVIVPLVNSLKERKTEVIKFLQQAEFESTNERMAIQGENTAPEEVLPYVTHFNSLVIPFNSPLRYQYWKGGQSPCDTLRELGRCDLLDKYRHPNSGN